MNGYEIAKTYLGLHEVKHNKILRSILSVNPAETAWCMDFVNACEHKAGSPGTGRLNARSALNYGRRIEPKDAKQGDIVIFSRGGSTWMGHVAYFDGWEKNKTIIRTLGGNQSDSVSIGWYPVSRLLGFRRYER